MPRQADIAKAMRAVIEAGREIMRVDIAPDGTVSLVISNGVEQVSPEGLSIWPNTSSTQSYEEVARLVSRKGESRRSDIFTAGGNVKKATALEWDRFTSLSYAERKQEAADLEVRWREQLQTKPLSKREQDCLRQLLRYGVGHPAECRAIKRLGAQAAERLQARGFITGRYQARHPDRIETYVLTVDGERAARTLSLSERPL